MRVKKLLCIITIFTFFIMAIANLNHVNAAENRISSVHVISNCFKPNMAKPGDVITITLGFENSLTNVESISNLKIKIGNSGEEKTLTHTALAISQNFIQFEYIVTANDNGIIEILSDTLTVDGEKFVIPDSTETITVDSLAPEVVQYKIDNIKPENYVTGDTIETSVIFNENIDIENSTSPLSLLIKFGDGNTKYATGTEVNDNVLNFEYKIKDEDIGNLQVLGLIGTIRDTLGNSTELNITFENSSTSITVNSNSNNDKNDNNDNNDNNSSQSPNKNTTGNDGTTSDKILPLTGRNYFMIAIIMVLALLGYISYINYIKYKGIK